MKEIINISLPEHALELFNPYRYKVLYGGRGGTKSWDFATLAIIKSLEKKRRVLCTRMFQNSIKDSVHKLISDRIDGLGLSNYFKITQDSIKCVNGSEFLFKGLQKSIMEIKSTEGIDIAWIEEAQNVSKEIWEILDPTIRKEDSEIWIGFNPEIDEDFIYKYFVISTPPPCSLIKKINYWDNPFFPEVLRRQMEHCKSIDNDSYLHIWCGETKKNTEAQIYKGKWEIKDFETPPREQIFEERFFHGCDWGFANDPTALIRCFIKDQCLWIDLEAGDVGIELDDLPKTFNEIHTTNSWTIIADNSRPETIAFMQRRGYDVDACTKWAGSVEEGIEYIRGTFRKIYVHPRCKNTISEFKNYSYKVDKNTSDILPVVVDLNNHWMDALRYALDPYIVNKVSIFDIPIR